MTTFTALPRRFWRYINEVRSETKKVTWPTQKMALIYSAFVIGTCIVMAAYFGVLDFGLSETVRTLLNR